jgi:hypothetical protein
MPRKRILVDVDANQWAALKGQAEVEGRFVRVLLAEALAMYLNRVSNPNPPTFVRWPAESQLVDVTPPTAKPTVEDLRALVETVKPETAREKAQRIAERQAWLRDHPEDEQQ